MGENRVIKAALLGLGTVGTGVYKVLHAQKEEMAAKLGAYVELKYILVRNLERAKAKVENPGLLTNDWNKIVNDPEVSVVIELMGGMEPAKTYTRIWLRRRGRIFWRRHAFIGVISCMKQQWRGEFRLSVR